MKTLEDSRLFARYALALFVVGLVGYAPLAAFARFEFAASFLVITELLALVLGVFGWREKPAKVAVVGVAIVILCCGMMYVGYLAVSQEF